MKRLFGALAILLLGCFCLPRAALADTTPPAPKWDGPPCQDFAVCSIDPPDPKYDFPSPCYVSVTPNPKIDPFSLSSVGFCQAARSMLVVPAQERDNAYAILTYWYVKFAAQMKVSKGGLIQNMAYQELISYMQMFEANWQAYKAAPSTATWQPLEGALINFVQFSVVTN